MNIFFDLDESFESYPNATKDKLFEIKLLMGERIKVLREEIEKEENSEKCCIGIHFSVTKNDFYLIYVGYSEELKVKLKDCLDDDYMAYIYSIISAS